MKPCTPACPWGGMGRVCSDSPSLRCRISTRKKRICVPVWGRYGKCFEGKCEVPPWVPYEITEAIPMKKQTRNASIGGAREWRSPQVWAGVCGGVHAVLWSIGQRVLQVDFRWNHSPSFQNCKCLHKHRLQGTHLFITWQIFTNFGDTFWYFKL